jgi:tetratricopeptide (TPR) repeat protein
VSARKRKAAKPAAPARAVPAVARPIGLLLVLFIAGGFVWHAVQWQFTQDDAYISLRYARNLVDGHGLVFNPGERVEGYSNFTWTLLLALFLKLGAPAVEASRWLGILFGTLAVVTAAKLARALEGRWGAASVGTALLVAATPAFAMWSTGGLETALYSFLVTAGLERGMAPGVGPRGRLFAPILLCLAALSRPDGPLVFVLWFALRTLDTLRGTGPLADPSGRRGLLRDLAIFGGPLVPYAIWKVAYYGDLLPNTYYAKAGLSAVYVRRGFDYALDYFRSYGARGIAPALALLAMARQGSRGVEARLLAIWLGVAAYIVVIGGDVLYLHRFWLPILPIGAVLVARGGTSLVGWVLPGRKTAPLVATVAFAALAWFGFRHNLDVTNQRRTTETLFVAKMKATGEWLKSHLPPDASVATTTIGAVAYSSGLDVIDMLGLTDREVAHHPEMFDGLTDTWREVKYNAASVLRREPDAILFSTDVRPSSAAERALYLYRSFHDSYYSLYYRANPAREQMQTVFLRRKDAPPFHGDRVQVDNYDFIEDYIQAHIEKGRNHDEQAALRLFDKAIELGPRNFPAAREWRAVTLCDLDDPRAEAALRAVVDEDPFATVAMGRLGLWYVRHGRLDDAEPLLRKLTEVNPGDSTGWAGLGEIFRQRGQYEQAATFMKRALAEWSTNAGELLGLANIATHLRDLDLARRCLNGVLALQPTGDAADAARGGLRALDAIRSGRISIEQVLENSR